MSLLQVYKAGVKHIEGVVVDRIAKEFNEPRIKETVREAATERANAIIEEQVNPVVAEWKADFNDLTVRVEQDIRDLEGNLASISEKMLTLSTALAKAVGKLADLQLYMQTALNAQAGYREAYDQLLKWSRDEAYPLREQAFQIWKKVTSAHDPHQYRSNWSPTLWYKNGDPSALSVPELTIYYRQQGPLDYWKPAIIDHIYKRNDISERDKLEFLAEVIEKDDSLDAVEYAGRYFGSLAGLKLYPLAISNYLEWWAANKDTLGDTGKE